jgi:CubicO group peptidase (beta-lactamase class C family)
MAAMLLALASLAVAQSPDPDSPRWKGVMALQAFFETSSDKELDRFLKKRIAPALHKKYKGDALREELRRIRADLSGMELQGARPQGPFSAQATFRSAGNEAIIPFTLESAPPHRFLQIAFIGADQEETSSRDPGYNGPSTSRREQAPDAAPMTWDNLEARLEQAVKDGFSGAVLVMRDGQPVLDRAYGMANRDKKISNRPDTIFAIGSTPIDFTRAGILLLEQRGKLSPSDPISDYFDDAPRDKRSITIEQLMTGRSGLQDFLGRPSDPNPDHFYIDRDEGMRRIFEDKLRFKPGERREHSHAAFGVLAAIIEIVSGQTYQEFTTEHLLKPAAMNDTGFFGEEYPEDRMALGYSDYTSGRINAPPYWGPTSWQVMGSGGQVSTTGDMYRWHRALADGKILTGEFLLRFWSPRGAVLAGGDMFGFEIVYTQGPETMMILISNNGFGQRTFQDLSRGLARLVNLESAPRFSLGIEMDVRADNAITIVRVVKGSAAERDGLRPGDVLLSIEGKSFGEDPLQVLDPYLATGKPIPFEIERDGKQQSVTVKPDPKT